MDRDLLVVVRFSARFPAPAAIEVQLKVLGRGVIDGGIGRGVERDKGHRSPAAISAGRTHACACSARFGLDASFIGKEAMVFGADHNSASRTATTASSFTAGECRIRSTIAAVGPQEAASDKLMGLNADCAPRAATTSAAIGVADSRRATCREGAVKADGSGGSDQDSATSGTTWCADTITPAATEIIG